MGPLRGNPPASRRKASWPCGERARPTTETYRAAVSHFASWAKEGGTALGVSGLAAYVEALRSSGVKAASLNLARSAIKAALLQAADRGGMAAREMAVLKTAIESIPGEQASERSFVRPFLGGIKGHQPVQIVDCSPTTEVLLRTRHVTVAENYCPRSFGDILKKPANGDSRAQVPGEGQQ